MQVNKKESARSGSKRARYWMLIRSLTLGFLLIIGTVSKVLAGEAAVQTANGMPAMEGMSHHDPGQMPEAVSTQLQQQVDREATVGRTENESTSANSGPYLMNKLMDQLDQENAKTRGVGNFQNSGMAHQAMQGPLLISNNEETVTPGGRCPAGAPVKDFDITAINVEITLNQYLDYYPGFMYVLTENLQRVRDEEKKNKEARSRENDPGAVSTGLQGDAIQPLVIRASAGDCVNITLRNQMQEDAVGLHIHGSSMIVKASGKPAVAANPEDTVASGKSQEFQWYIRPDTQEGGHHLHSHVGRDQSALGMQGVFNIEPRGARYLDPWTGKDLKSGWLAMIEDPSGPDFREFTIIYHEIGDESFRPLNRKGEPLPQRDPITDTYRPGGRALNYRSEPFMNNFQIQHELLGFSDESLGYSTYAFGDPATPIPRSYLGDPAKWRMVHGGSEVFHSHHLHGGSIRWARQQDAGDTQFALASNGPVKQPQIRTISDRVDVQMIGPTEVFDQVNECGSGGCQHTAGDFLWHCHVGTHYLAGMWSFWRVYNTLQIPTNQNDVMVPLAELPDRKGKAKPAVDSAKLVGTTVDWYDGFKFKLTPNKTDWNASPKIVAIEDWVETMIPPPGLPGKVKDQIEQAKWLDATVWDWTKEKTPDGKLLYKGEPETTYVWPKYKPMKVKAGERPPLMFDPLTGKLAWPHMTPHFGKRPPFAPNHSGAPWLEPIHLTKDGKRSSEPPQPGENGPWSLCPQGAPIKQYTINQIHLPITMAKADGKNPAIVDPNGLIFALAEEEAEIRATPDKQIPLVIRANVRDCVNVILKSKIPNTDEDRNFSKHNLHIHFVQFDVQASDGVISGFSYDQAVRPFTMLKDEPLGPPHKPQNELLVANVDAGKMQIEIADASRFHPKTEIGIGMDQVETFEIRRIEDIKGNVLTLNEPLSHVHKKDEIVSVEFVRERWYADADFGTTYFHDHVNPITGWAHGLTGALIVEPIGSTYHDPKTGKEVRSGDVVDIHTTEPVSSNVVGSFREIVIRPMDSVARTANKIAGVKSVQGSGAIKFPADMLTTANPYLNGGEATTGTHFDMRVAPLNRRLIVNPDQSKLFSSAVHGDPDTPMLRTYLGDPILIRALVHGANETHTLTVMGHWFKSERYAPTALPKSTQHLGIAERYDLAIPAAGGPQQMAGDYLYYNGRPSHFAEGAWGIFRVLDKETKDLQVLPGHEDIPASAKSVCPVNAPVKTFNVMAIDKALRFNKSAPEALEVDFDRKLNLGNPNGKIYVLEGEKATVAAGTMDPMPLVLHVNVGDCVKVNLKNEMAKARAGFHVSNMAYDPKESMGANVGTNAGDQTVAPGKSRSYTFYAHPEYGENAALIQDWGNILENPRNGLYGGIIVGPRGSKYRDPSTGDDVSLKNAWKVDVIVDASLPENFGRSNYRDASLLFQDEDNIMGTSFMPYLQQVAGLTGVNYRAEPYQYRQDEKNCEPAEMFHCTAGGDPSTPIIEAHAGDSLTLHVFGAFNEQNGVFSLEGNEWPLEPYMNGSDLLSSFQFGSGEVLNVVLHGGAGGPDHLPGDYLWMNHRLPYMSAGEWGLLRVLPQGDKRILALEAPNFDVRPVSLGENVK